MSERVVLIGEAELQRKLKAKLGTPKAARDLFDTWRFEIERDWKSKVVRGPGGWLWKGGDRRSITSERDQSDMPKWARVGSNSKTLRFGEYGTGLLSEDPESTHRRYFPPPAALDEWAIQHGFRVGSLAGARGDIASSPGTYGYIVAMMIYKAGGTKPRRFGRDAAEAAAGKIDGWLDDAARTIETTAPEL